MNHLTDLIDLLELAASAVEIDGTGVLDICGTGGDGFKTFNISTAAAIVCASLGCKVAKHCGGSSSGNSGSSDVLSVLGYNHYPTAAVSKFSATGFMAVHAIDYNPVMARLSGPRKSLGRPTVFNLIAPLLNPVKPTYRVIGTSPIGFSTNTLTQLERICDRAWLLSAEDGMDEISTCTPTRVLETFTGMPATRETIYPHHYGYVYADNTMLTVFDSEHSAEIIKAVFNNTAHPQQIAAVVLNAAAGLYVAGKTISYDAGVEIAKYAIVSGLAEAKLKQVIG